MPRSSTILKSPDPIENYEEFYLRLLYILHVITYYVLLSISMRFKDTPSENINLKEEHYARENMEYNKSEATFDLAPPVSRMTPNVSPDLIIFQPLFLFHVYQIFKHSYYNLQSN